MKISKRNKFWKENPNPEKFFVNLQISIINRRFHSKNTKAKTNTDNSTGFSFLHQTID